MSSNWNPKPRRPNDPNPLFKMNDEFVIKGQTPIQRQRQLDGTPHTKGGPTRLHPGNAIPVGDNQPELYLGKSIGNDGDNEPVPEGAKDMSKSVDPDAVVKSFLSKATPPPVGGEEKRQPSAPRAGGGSPAGGEEKQKPGSASYGTRGTSYNPMAKAAASAGRAKRGAAAAAKLGMTNAPSQDAAPKAAEPEEDEPKLTMPKTDKKPSKAAAAGKTAGKVVTTAGKVAGRVASAVASVVPTSGR